MHNHCRVEKLPDEILAAFKANDRQHSGTIHSKHLKHLLQGWGEHLNSKEGMLFIILKLNGLGDTNPSPRPIFSIKLIKKKKK